jgi:hypothetical protein
LTLLARTPWGFRDTDDRRKPHRVPWLRVDGHDELAGAVVRAAAGGFLWPAADNLTLAAVAVTAVPEPETYALMLGGLGLLGFISRRRQAK